LFLLGLGQGLAACSYDLSQTLFTRQGTGTEISGTTADIWFIQLRGASAQPLTGCTETIQAFGSVVPTRFGVPNPVLTVTEQSAGSATNGQFKLSLTGYVAGTYKFFIRVNGVACSCSSWSNPDNTIVTIVAGPGDFLQSTMTFPFLLPSFSEGDFIYADAYQNPVDDSSLASFSWKYSR